jgi:peptide/nickel transport system substrate-binding protein
MIGNASGIPFGVELNGSRGIFADLQVRRALAMAVDRRALCDDLFFGMINPSYGPLSSTTPAYWPGVKKMYSPNVKQAMAMLDAAGWKNGQRLSAFYGAPPPLEPDTAVELQGILKRIGFDIQVQTITLAHNQQLVFANSYDMLPVRWIQADPMCLDNLFASKNISSPGHYRYNWMHLNDPALDKLLAQGAGTTDPAKRDAVYEDAQKRIMDTALWFPVHDQVETVAHRANRSGYHFDRSDWVVLFYDVQAA